MCPLDTCLSLMTAGQDVRLALYRGGDTYSLDIGHTPITRSDILDMVWWLGLQLSGRGNSVIQFEILIL